MSNATEDPRCPECGEPIGQTATYCMHCSADLTEEREAADVDDDGWWEQTDTESADAGTETADSSAQLLDPDGFVDDTLTVVVGIAGGIVVGLVGTAVLVAVTGSGWGFLFGVVSWLGATAYLVRRRTVQDAVSKTGYAVAVVLLLVPVIALSPVVSVEGGLGGRGELFAGLLVFVFFPAGFAAAVGWIASQFVPEKTGGEVN